MSNLEKPPGWSDEQFDAYLGSEDDPIEDEAEIGGIEVIDLYAGYDPNDRSDPEGGTVT